MIITLALGALIGGVTSFVWNAISWMALPWHHATYKPFADEDAVTRALLQHAPTDGVYGLPAPPRTVRGAPKETNAAAEKAVEDKLRRGPLATVVFQRDGYGSLKPKLAVALLTGVIASLLFTTLLVLAPSLSYSARVETVALAAFAGAVAGR